MTKEGIEQMKITGKKLKNLGIRKLYASSEYRALQSAKLIGKACGLEAITLVGMEERNWGIYAEKPWPEVKAVLDTLSVEERYNYIPPKGESWKVFENRLIHAINRVVQENKDSIICIVTHGGSIRALFPYLLGIPKEESFKYDPKNASISIFDFENNEIKMVCMDDISHLAVCEI